jgi:hypothetical protein
MGAFFLRCAEAVVIASITLVVAKVIERAFDKLVPEARS